MTNTIATEEHINTELFSIFPSSYVIITGREKISFIYMYGTVQLYLHFYMHDHAWYHAVLRVENAITSHVNRNLH